MSQLPPPGAPDAKGRISLPTLRRLFSLAMPHKRLLLAAGVLILIDTGITLMFPLLARAATNAVSVAHSLTVLNHYAMFMVLLLVTSGLLMYIQFLLVAAAGNRVVWRLRKDVYAHMLRLPVAYFDTRRSGDLTTYLANDVTQVQQTLTDDVVRLAGNIVTLVGGVGLAIALDWRLTAISVGLIIALISFFVFFGGRLRKLTRAGNDALAAAMGGMTEALSNVRLIKSFTREEYQVGQADTALGTVFTLLMRAARIEGSFGAVGSAGSTLVLLVVVWYGGSEVLAGQITSGSLLAFLVTVAIISTPMSSLAMQFTRLQRSLGASERIFAILDETAEISDNTGAVPFPHGPGAIEFRNVSFAYQPDVPVLTCLTITLLPGKVTALVGPSGSGKTTVASLLYRFYEPQAGAIVVDNVDIRTIRREDLREHIGIVPQEPVLFSATLRDNIRFGRLDATPEEIEAAAAAANVHEFARQLRQRYDTLIGERGITLSGGQRQRVAIARAVLKDPSILVLDEATSALDTRSEALVREALERLMSGRTTLVIAHRLSTIKNADCIAVLADGELAESGTHEELLRRGGHYATLHDINTEDEIAFVSQ